MPAQAVRAADTSPNLHTSAALIGLVAAGFYLLMQVEIVLRFHWRHAALADNLREVAWLVFSQNENLLVAALWVALWLFAAPRLFTRRLFVALFSLALLYLVINQLAYGALLGHLQFEGEEDRKLSLLRLVDSTVAIMGPAFVFNLLVWAFLVALLARRLLPAQSIAPAPAWLAELRRHDRFYLLLALAFIGFGGFNTTPLHNYADHPLVTLARSAARVPAGLADIPYDPALDIDTLVHGTPGWQPADEAAIEVWGRSGAAGAQPPGRFLRAADAQGHRPEGRAPTQGPSARPNIIYVILESVGALNLLPDGTPDPAVTPNLARHWPHTVAFPALYNTFPGSTRSHLPILTGGHTYTWGGGLAEARFKYRGPTLPGLLREQGYRTGLFSAMFMDTEDFDTVYAPLPFDARLIPEHEPEAWQQAHRLNSWGVDEREALRRAHQWLDGLDRRAPWFLLFLNGNTHHPYSVPADYAAPFPADTALGRYKNSLHFADHLIGRMVERLAARGELENTLIAISGDHGQAFGEHHPTNFLHRNHLYEENIRNFLLVLDFRLQDGPLVSQKRGMIGDILPTLLGRAGIPAPPVRGQNLADPGYAPRIHYFHKTTAPEQWGLVDGQWKFIAERTGSGGAQLFNLDRDPREQHNLAASLPERVEHYRRLAAQWYIRTDRDFASRLEDAADYVESLSHLGRLSREGPFVLRIGKVPEGDAPFRPGTAFAPGERLTAYTNGNAFEREQTLIYTWIAPDGRIHPVAARHRAGIPSHHAPAPDDLVLTPGQWQVRLADTDGRALLSAAFTVENSVPQGAAAPRPVSRAPTNVIRGMAAPATSPHITNTVSIFDKGVAP